MEPQTAVPQGLSPSTQQLFAAAVSVAKQHPEPPRLAGPDIERAERIRALMIQTLSERQLPADLLPAKEFIYWSSVLTLAAKGSPDEALDDASRSFALSLFDQKLGLATPMLDAIRCETDAQRNERREHEARVDYSQKGAGDIQRRLMEIWRRVGAELQQGGVEFSPEEEVERERICSELGKLVVWRTAPTCWDALGPVIRDAAARLVIGNRRADIPKDYLVPTGWYYVSREAERWMAADFRQKTGISLPSMAPIS